MIHNLPAYASSKNVEMTIVKVQNNCLLILGLDFPELIENNKLMVTPFSWQNWIDILAYAFPKQDHLCIENEIVVLNSNREDLDGR